MAKEEPEQKKKVSRIKVKKKVWYKILSPALFGEKEIGEAYLVSADSAVGRKMKVNLKDLTGNMRDQNAYIIFEIKKAVANILHTRTIGYELTASFVKRLVRKSADRLDDYFTFTLKDGRSIIIKIMIITLNSTQRSTQKQIRKQIQELFREEISKLDLDGTIGSIISYKLQGESKKKLAKITPLKEIAIKYLGLATGKAQITDTVAEAVAVEKAVEETAEEMLQEASQEA